MKNRFVIAFLVLSFQFSAQCSADAGAQVSFCADGSTNYFLQGSGGGNSPLTYTWSCKPIVWPSGLTFYAHHLLSDTSASQPQLVDSEINDSILFYLEVTDANTCTSLDSVLVVFSTFTKRLEYHTFNLPLGDSVFLDYGTNIVGGIEPIIYVWHPSSSLSDSTSLEFWAKPDVSTSYYCTITDALGCSAKASPYYYINVYGVGIEEQTKETLVVIYQAASKILEVKTSENSKNEVIKLIDATGKIWFTQNLHSTDTSIFIDVKALPNGFYFIDFGEIKKKIQIY